MCAGWGEGDKIESCNRLASLFVKVGKLFFKPTSTSTYGGKRVVEF